MEEEFTKFCWAPSRINGQYSTQYPTPPLFGDKIAVFRFSKRPRNFENLFKPKFFDRENCEREIQNLSSAASLLARFSSPAPPRCRVSDAAFTTRGPLSRDKIAVSSLRQFENRNLRNYFVAAGRIIRAEYREHRRFSLRSLQVKCGFRSAEPPLCKI